MRSVLLSSLLFAVAALSAGCKREDDGPTAQPPPPGYAPPGQFVPPQGAYTPAPPQGGPYPAPAGAPAPAAGAIGFPCQSDLDLQCPFGRCINGHCGGCATASDCKPGNTCAWTPIGMACIVAAGASPMPTIASPGSPAPPPVGSGVSDGFQSARRLCVDRTNEFRARVGAAPLTRNNNQESCNDQQARSDGSTNAIHGAFGRCNESAQNECPSWPGPPENVIGPCLQQMFDEGPGGYADHGHYINMTNRQYTSVSCGVYVTANGKVWVIQDFY